MNKLTKKNVSLNTVEIFKGDGCPCSSACHCDDEPGDNTKAFGISVVVTNNIKRG
ncbi:MAG: CLI_3235 family bacteriocin precursor [Clostridia bacterium]|nr:CLI_3235 family bacteriocin precursor [Clostridia bacterium]